MSLDDRNAALNEALEENPVDEQVAALVKGYNLLKLAFIFLACLTIITGLAAAVSYNSSQKAERAKDAVVSRCEETNKARAKNAKLWDYLIDQSKNQPRDAEKQKFFDDFVTLKNETFAPTGCSQLKQLCYNQLMSKKEPEDRPAPAVQPREPGFPEPEEE